MSKRVCIVGTFSTYRQTPWNDPSIEIWSLNDAYTLGFPRADRWFEIHPLDKMWFRDPRTKVVDPRDIPAGHYVRPKGHLEWLQKQAATIPVYLQNDPPEGWPANAQRFPIERVHEAFGADYWACGPSYMLALAALEGYTEIWITGIHLATQAEYIQQRPQWENLLGRLLGPTVKTETRNGFTYHEGAITVVMPESCPILKHGWKYAYEEKPKAKPDPDAVEWKAVQQEKAALVTALVHWPKGKDKSKALARLQRLEIIELDIQQMRAKRAMSGTLTRVVAA